MWAFCTYVGGRLITCIAVSSSVVFGMLVSLSCHFQNLTEIREMNSLIFIFGQHGHTVPFISIPANSWMITNHLTLSNFLQDDLSYPTSAQSSMGS